MHKANIRQTEIRTADLLVSEIIPFGFELKRYKLLVFIKSAELMQVGTWCIEIQKLSDSAWNRERLSKQWTESVTVSVYGKGNTADCNSY